MQPVQNDWRCLQTTTLSILCGTQQPTAGDGLVNGTSIVTNRRAAAALLGYCPQIDPLLDKLTGVEQLSLYARLKVKDDGR